MPESKVSSALTALRSELEDVERQLAGYDTLRHRRERLLAAIEATEAVEALGRPVPAVSEEVLNGTILRAILSRHLPTAQPTTPSEAAIAILRELGRPLHIRDLVTLVQGKGWFVNRTYESLRGTIAGTLDARAAREGGGIIKPSPGTYLWMEAMRSDPLKPEPTVAERGLEQFSEGWRSAMSGGS